MSKFKIYKSDRPNPEVSIKRSKVVASSLVLITPLTILVTDHLITWKYKDYLIILAALIFGYLLYWNYKKAKSLKQIGELTITEDGLVKTIDNFSARIAFDNLKGIEVRKYYTGMFSMGGKYGYHSMVVSFIFSDKTERLIISDVAINDAKFSALENLRYLEKTLKVDLHIR